MRVRWRVQELKAARQYLEMGLDRHPSSERIAEELRALRTQVHKGTHARTHIGQSVPRCWPVTMPPYAHVALRAWDVDRWSFRRSDGLRDCGRNAGFIPADATVTARRCVAVNG